MTILAERLLSYKFWQSHSSSISGKTLLGEGQCEGMEQFRGDSMFCQSHQGAECKFAGSDHIGVIHNPV